MTYAVTRLHGQLVDLRPLEESDLEARLKMVNDPQVQRLYIGALGDENTMFDMESWFHSLREDPFSEQWAIVTKDGQYIGDIDLHSIHVLHGEVWVSPMLGNLQFAAAPDYRREAVELITQYAFDEHAVERVLMDVPSTDAQGIDIAKQLGFVVIEESLLDFLHDVQTVTLEATAASFQKS